ncbi:hypothetical protein BH24ACT26_BH24ACT26_12210 [soil metagenome]
MLQLTEVRITSDSNRDWLVWFESKVVGRFPRVGDALAYAAMLECSPRERGGAAAV